MDQLPAIVSGSSTALIIAIAAHTSWKLKQSATTDLYKIYEDQDGLATEESQKKYFSTVRIVKLILTAAWTLGFLVSLLAAILNTVHISSLLLLHWFTFASWVS